MPRPTKGPRLGGGPAHERMMLANLATSLFRHRSIVTTEAKAKRLRPYAERLITKARRGDLHNRRQVHKVIRDKEVVHFLFAEIGPGFAERDGGYTRITKLGPRKGDNAPMAAIELVEFGPVESQPKAKKSSGSAAQAGSTAAAGATTATAATDATATEDTEAEDTEAEDTGTEDTGTEDTESETESGAGAQSAAGEAAESATAGDSDESSQK